MRRLGLFVMSFALVAASACAGGSSGGSSSSTTSAKASKKSSRKSSKSSTTVTTRNPLAIEGSHGPGCQFIVAGTGKRVTTPGPIVEYLNDAVAAPTACYDKVTFTFDKGNSSGLPPGYKVEYRKKPFGLLGPDGKALATTTAGFSAVKAVLYVEMQPASTNDLRKPGRPITTYKGNLRLLLGKQIKHVVIVEWIQNLPPDATPATQNDDKVVWLIGLDAKRRFTVDFASQPVPHVNVLIMH